MPIPPIQFHVIEPRASVPANAQAWSAYLNRDDWDDWGKYCTQFYLTVVDRAGIHHDIGQLKIGQRQLKPHAWVAKIPDGYRKPNLDSMFGRLGESFFSVGQDAEYYSNLGALGEGFREQILRSLRDVAFDKERWEWAKNEDVTMESLLRSVTKSTVEGQFRRMAHGDARVTKYRFSYSPPKRMGDGEPPFVLDFNVDPDSPIPTNVHVLIGRNGVGKTRLLSLMTKALVAKDSTARQSGNFRVDDDDGGEFANVVAVSFSAFDEGELLPDRSAGPNSIGYSYIGLRRVGGSSDAAINAKTPNALAVEFLKSLKVCHSGARRRRWMRAIETLQSDPVFQSAQITDLIDIDFSDKEVLDSVLKTFRKLSSGHKIVLLTMTRLVEKVEERTLVLIDEPEAHLHPPLLSAMTRAVSELMVRQNGVAIVATHSPVILQEVPKSCAWILNRILSAAKAERPAIETFAESVGVLSREVFQLELSQSGYHQLLRSLKNAFSSYKEAIRELDGNLGSEGKAVLRAMYLYEDAE